MTATLQNVAGFQGCRSLNGGSDIIITVPVSSSTGNQFFIGDAVKLKTTGKAAPASSTSNIWGIVQGIFKSNNAGQPAPLTFNLPSIGLYLQSSQAGFVSINTDPYKTYLAPIDVTASTAMIGSMVHISAGTPVTAAGRSGMTLAKTTSTSADGQFQIVGLAPTDLVNGYAAEYGNSSGKGVVEVKINFAAFGVNSAGV
jgi:hypothetical protein